MKSFRLTVTFSHIMKRYYPLFHTFIIADENSTVHRTVVTLETMFLFGCCADFVST